MRNLASTIVTFVAVASASGAASCVDIPESGQKPVLATHVDDWRDEVLYQALVDRFANGDVNNDFRVKPGKLARYQGGDWKGMTDHLDYLEALGITTVWISPIVKNVETDADVDAYHGYWAQDLTEVNPHFGDLAQLRSLVKAAHTRNMKVVLDVVVNHMGQVFFYDMNLNGTPDIYLGGTGSTSPVLRSTEFDPDWDARGVQAFTSLGIAGRAPIVFIADPSINRIPPKPGIMGRGEAYHGFGRVLNYEDDLQRLLGDFPGGLKDVATEVPEVRRALVDVYAKWVEEVDFDGLRLDTVKHVEHEFWQVFSKALRSRLAAQGKNKFLLFGEAFDGRDELLASYTAPGELDSVFYFSQHYNAVRDVFEYAHDAAKQRGTQQIADLWGRRSLYGGTPQDNGIAVAPRKSLVNFLDNHDVARFLFEAKGDTSALRNALTLIFTEEGIPCVYYGTEQDFSGGNDPGNREILWEKQFATGGDTFRHLANLAKLRKAYTALRRGDTRVTWASHHTSEEADAGIFAFERTGGDAGANYALVVMNTNARKTSETRHDGTTMAVTAAPATTLVNILDIERRTYTVGDGGKLYVSLPAQTSALLVPSDQVVN
jgi:glycosidase